ncbi:unnamed protein product [Symbiodinium natans]|uniref:Uncharacterized protein n=1 Tax=Symbiodinium natans TaxID=878477 RepID=A0A812R8C1_9DINO|nr:unnamed protein product [Symbiodinium natans]
MQRTRRPAGIAGLLVIVAVTIKGAGCGFSSLSGPAAGFGHERARWPPCRAGIPCRSSISEVTASWSEAERKALELLEEKQPAWRRSYLGPKTEEDVQETFRAIASAAGGEEQGLNAIERNLALMVFLPKQIAASSEALSAELGPDVALDVIRKNPGVLTVPPASIKENVGAIVPIANVVGFFADNPLFAQGLFAVLGLAVTYAVVVASWLERPSRSPPFLCSLAG